MALAAIGFAKAKRRRQLMVAASSIGPGATNMVTAAALAHSNRLPALLPSGDTFATPLTPPRRPLPPRRARPGEEGVRTLGEPAPPPKRRLQASLPLLGPDHAPRT